MDYYCGSDGGSAKIADSCRSYLTGSNEHGHGYARTRVMKTLQSNSAALLEKQFSCGRFNHPNIVTAESVYRSAQNFFLVMPQAEMCYSDVLRGQKVHSDFQVDLLKENDFQNAICSQMVSAVGFLHRSGYLHADVKLDNFLLTKDLATPKKWKILLCDFGTVQRFDLDLGSKSYGKGPEKNIYGSTDYFSMEKSQHWERANDTLPPNAVIKWQQSLGDDTYALGLCVLGSLCREVPWYEFFQIAPDHGIPKDHVISKMADAFSGFKSLGQEKQIFRDLAQRYHWLKEEEEKVGFTVEGIEMAKSEHRHLYDLAVGLLAGEPIPESRHRVVPAPSNFQAPALSRDVVESICIASVDKHSWSLCARVRDCNSRTRTIAFSFNCGFMTIQDEFMTDSSQAVASVGLQENVCAGLVTHSWQRALSEIWSDGKLPQEVHGYMYLFLQFTSLWMGDVSVNQEAVPRIYRNLATVTAAEVYQAIRDDHRTRLRMVEFPDFDAV